MQKPAQILLAFSQDQVEKLTGLSKWQLERWDQIGFFQPEFGGSHRSRGDTRIYSFADVVGLKILAILRRTHKIPLADLKLAAATQSEKGQKFWSENSFYVLNRELHLSAGEDNKIVAVPSGQLGATIPVDTVQREIKAKADSLLKRDQNKVGRLEKRRQLLHNQPVVGGTRIPVWVIEDFINEGYSNQAILKEYPTLEIADLEAVRLMKRENVRAG